MSPSEHTARASRAGLRHRLSGLAAMSALILASIALVATPASAATNTLAPVSIITTAGALGSGQTVGNLAVKEQSGSQNNWAKYIEFSPSGSNPYNGDRTYTLPGSVAPSSVTAIQVTANYKGPSGSNEPIGQVTAHQRREEDERRVRPVQPRRVTVAPLQIVDEVEHEERAHSVIREALPHLDDEQEAESARVSHERGVVEHRWSVERYRANFICRSHHWLIPGNGWTDAANGPPRPEDTLRVE